MNRATLLPVQTAGILVGGVLGAVRTREAAVHLLAKNELLAAAGIPALPGAGQGSALASWAPAAAGSAFFGLSLGLGAATVLGLWILVTRTLLPGRRWAPWTVLAAPGAAAAAGDPGLAVAVLAIALHGLWTVHGASSIRSLAARVGMTVAVAAGLLPLALAPEGPFTRVRDRWLLAQPGGVGLALDELYYTWTLFPAEAIKPLAARTQPVADVGTGPPFDRFCREADPLRVLCVPRPDAPGADFRVEVADGDQLRLVGRASTVPWPRAPDARADAWRAFSRQEDRARVFRRATAWSLFFGGPLAVAWALASLPWSAGGLCPAGRTRWVVRVVGTAVLAAAVAAAAVRPPWLVELDRALPSGARPVLAEVQRFFASERPVERFRAVKAAGRVGAAATPILIEALSDPVINVRYAAAASLGSAPSPRVRDLLLRVLTGDDAWYVKERAYAALWRTGWRP